MISKERHSIGTFILLMLLLLLFQFHRVLSEDTENDADVNGEDINKARADLVSADIEGVRESDGSVYNQPQADRNVPLGAVSLAFVFDITGSMYDDLVQVIEGAAKILTTTLARRHKPLYNYVLVPFHDPGKCSI